MPDCRKSEELETRQKAFESHLPAITALLSAREFTTVWFELHRDWRPEYRLTYSIPAIFDLEDALSGMRRLRRRALASRQSKRTAHVMDSSVAIALQRLQYQVDGVELEGPQGLARLVRHQDSRFGSNAVAAACPDAMQSGKIGRAHV